MTQEELAKLPERLRGIAFTNNLNQYDHAVLQLSADTLEELAKHEQQGGITMKCGHPVQCAYPDGDDGRPSCNMCDLQKEVDSHYIGGK